MPAWMTPELWPVWCCAIVGSRSRTVTVWPRRCSSRATARPTMPAPTMAMSARAGSALSGRSGGPALDVALEDVAQDVLHAERQVPPGVVALELLEVADVPAMVADARLVGQRPVELPARQPLAG